MNYDEYGQVFTTEEELCGLLYKNPTLDLSKFLVVDSEKFNQSVASLHYDYPKLNNFIKPDISIEEFDRRQQENWYMPKEYKQLDIAKWTLDQCRTQEELQRVGQELLLYQERNLFNLLKFLKYLVDVLRKNNLVWGVGRGSSVASYVLFLIGVHKINSIQYELNIEEFLK
jgi:DNA polymerase III alpha subunit